MTYKYSLACNDSWEIDFRSTIHISRRRLALRRILASIIAALAITMFEVRYVSAQQSRQQVRFVPNVPGQFNALSSRPDPLGFNIGGGPDPSQCRHHQAIIRMESADGTPYFIISRSGPPRDFCDESIDPIHVGNPIANLYIVRMTSRNKDGERLRSNRLQRFLQTSDTPPEADDIVVRSILYDGSTAEWPHYDHPGGMQQVGNIVALGLEFPARIFIGPGPDDWVQEDPNADPVVVQFIDFTDPENPHKKSTFVPREPGVRAGTLALTPCSANRQGLPCATGHYLLGTTGGNNEVIHFYESTGNDLSSPTLGWNLLYTWHKEELLNGEWPGNAHQTLNFLREGDLNGALYLAGARGEAFGDDNIDLYRVDLEGSRVRMTWVSTQHKISHPAGEGETSGPEIADFRAATGFYVSPTGELLLYATEHDNDGPEGSNGRGSVKMGEWRHIGMVRPDSPTLAPSVKVGGPFVVNEGQSLTLSATGAPPITKAWIQLFRDPNFAFRYVVVEYDDWQKDNFDNFLFLDPGFFGDPDGATDDASSWRWFAPEGCTLRVNQHSFNDSNFPGRTRTLLGTGRVEEESDLHGVLDDNLSGSMNDMISSVQFFRIGADSFPDCRDYYNAPIGVAWDFDRDGTFETMGANPIFSAADLDGPSVRSVLVHAQHPTDLSPIGRSLPMTVEIEIRNVPPSIESFDFVDSFGSRIGTDVPFGLVNVEYAAKATFIDPGRQDHQTATLNFGDGGIISSSMFNSFNDAFGGTTGQLVQRHTFGTPGTYTVRLAVSDDDGGDTGATRSLTVVSPVEALRWVVARIDLLVSGSSDRRVVAALRNARDSLAGNHDGGASNGALQKLETGNLVAALVKIRAAVESLENAEAAGAGDLSGLKHLLGLTAESIAHNAANANRDYLNVNSSLTKSLSLNRLELRRAEVPSFFALDAEPNLECTARRVRAD